MTLLPLLLALPTAAIATPALPAESGPPPVRVVEESLPLPADLTMEQALASVGDIPRIFELYEPLIPRIPGVSVALGKEVVSYSTPAILEMPVSGKAIGYRITERARVTATSEPVTCETDANGRRITLDFGASSYNIERRIDRIEITACPERDAHGAPQIHAVARMYEGFKPQDPALNALSEAIGSKALQGAFIKQVSPILEAVQQHWSSL